MTQCPYLLKKLLNFWKDSRRRWGSNLGPLGPTNLESSVLLTELSRLVKSWGSNRKYILQFKYYVVLGMAYKARFQKKRALDMQSKISSCMQQYSVTFKILILVGSVYSYDLVMGRVPKKPVLGQCERNVTKQYVALKFLGF